MSPQEEAVSREVNHLLGGSRDELFCSRVYRERWRLRADPAMFVCWVGLDLFFLLRRGEWRHCRNRNREHQERTFVEALINAGL